MMRSSDRPGVRVPPPLLFLLVALPGAALERYVPRDLPVNLPRPLVWPAVVLLAASLYLALHAIIAFKRHGTHVDPARPSTVIVAAGPFRFTRNPMYLALVLILLALAVMWLSVWFLAGAAALLLLLDRLAVAPEERYLAGKFGDAYTAYRARVRRWI
jgi:protein-S-isoprenylcysteine O-methyltransferase Ste14